MFKKNKDTNVDYTKLNEGESPNDLSTDLVSTLTPPNTMSSFLQKSF